MQLVNWVGVVGKLALALHVGCKVWQCEAVKADMI